VPGQVPQHPAGKALNILQPGDILEQACFELGEPILSNSKPPPSFNFGWTISSFSFTSTKDTLLGKTTFLHPSPAFCKAIFWGRRGTQSADVDAKQKK